MEGHLLSDPGRDSVPMYLDSDGEAPRDLSVGTSVQSSGSSAHAREISPRVLTSSLTGSVPRISGDVCYNLYREYSVDKAVKETFRIQKRYDSLSGRKIINRYEIIGLIGRGVHGKVKLAKELSTSDYVAIKTLEKLGRKRFGRSDSVSQEQKIRREIAILKKCLHPHVVRLIEVMDDPMSRKIYLVLEYMEGGEIIWRTKNDKPALTLEQTRSSIRDTILGLEYLHFQGVIHRDIKPANLLWTKTRSVKIADFGVSYISSSDNASSHASRGDLELAKTAGTPAFFAPELCWSGIGEQRPKITKAIDVWALGVTFFCLLFGRVPWTADTEYELLRKISSDPLELPDDVQIDEDTADLLRRLLEKDSETRLTLDEAKRHPFTIAGISDVNSWLTNTDPANYGLVEVSQQEMIDAVSIVDKLKRSFRKISKTMFNITNGLRRTTLSSDRSDADEKPESQRFSLRGLIRRNTVQSNSMSRAYSRYDSEERLARHIERSSRSKERNSNRVFEKRVYSPPSFELCSRYPRGPVVKRLMASQITRRYRSASEDYLPIMPASISAQLHNLNSSGTAPQSSGPQYLHCNELRTLPNHRDTVSEPIPRRRLPNDFDRGFMSSFFETGPKTMMSTDESLSTEDERRALVDASPSAQSAADSIASPLDLSSPALEKPDSSWKLSSQEQKKSDYSQTEHSQSYLLERDYSRPGQSQGQDQKQKSKLEEPQKLHEEQQKLHEEHHLQQPQDPLQLQEQSDESDSSREGVYMRSSRKSENDTEQHNSEHKTGNDAAEDEADDRTDRQSNPSLDDNDHKNDHKNEDESRYADAVE